MSNDTVRPATVGQLVRRRWRLLVVLAAVGAIFGAGASLLYPPRYEATSRVVVQGSQESDELDTEVQLATSSVVLDRTAAALGWAVSGTDLRDVVSAEAVEGNVIEIRGAAETPERAQQLTDRTAQEFMAYSAALASNMVATSDQVQVSRERQEALRRQIEETNAYIAWLRDSSQPGAAGNRQNDQVITELEELRVVLNKAATELNSAQAASGRANLAIIGWAERPSSPKPPTLVHFVVAGLLLFFLLGVVGHLVAARADRRLRAASGITAALGSPILGSVDVPDARSAGSTGRKGRRDRILRLVWNDQPWDVPMPQISDDLSLDARYHRVLTRLHGMSDPVSGTAKALVLVADDDAIAHRAAERLAVMADAEGELELRVVDIHAGRPMVPERNGVSGVLIALTPGTRTAWELVGIAEACADAGHEILGAVVTFPTARSRSARATRAASPETRPKAAADRDAMAGSA